MRAGAAFRFRESRGDSYAGAHLWVVISDPIAHQSELLLVNFSSRRAGMECDLSCVVDVGDHSFVRHPTFVFYARALVLTAAQIEAAMRKGLCSEEEPVSEVLLQRMRAGAAISPFLRQSHRALLIAQELLTEDPEQDRGL